MFDNFLIIWFDIVAGNKLSASAEGRASGLDVQRRRRGAEREELRLQILDAVSRLHESGGYGAVTMRSVANEVGVSAMSLYRYFPNKAALLEHVWLGVLDAALDATSLRDGANDQPVQRLRQLYESYIRFWLAHPQDFKLVFDPHGTIPHGFLQEGPARRFRYEAESLIDACLGPSADAARRETAYDLCRIKVIGFLYTAIGLETKPHRSTEHLLKALLDDLERQLQSVR